jgi:hypothetical protein
MIPSVVPMSGALLIQWNDFVEPEDFESYDVYYGSESPPATHWTKTTAKETTISGLTPGTIYYAQVFANDPFGPGVGSGIVEGTPL